MCLGNYIVGIADFAVIRHESNHSAIAAVAGQSQVEIAVVYDVAYSSAVYLHLNEMVGIFDFGKEETVGSEFTFGVSSDKRAFRRLHSEFCSGYSLAVGHANGESAADSCGRHFNGALRSRSVEFINGRRAGEFNRSDEVEITAE